MRSKRRQRSQRSQRSKRSIECWLFHKTLKKFLLLRCPMTSRHPEYWQPVTGGVFHRETWINACLREVWEETGIVLKPSKVHTVLKEFRVFVPEYKLEVRKPVFTAQTTMEQVLISDEHLAYQWVSPEHTKEFLFWESNKRSFDAVHAFYQQHNEPLYSST